MGGERSRQGCNVSLHVAGSVSSRFADILDLMAMRSMSRWGNT